MTTWDELFVLLNQGDSQTVAFEKDIPSPEDLARELVAFSNTDGGKLILGIDAINKHLLGIKVNDETRNLLDRIGVERCSPAVTPEIEILDKDSRMVMIMNIHEGYEKPYRADDICYVRDGKESRPARETEVKEISSPYRGKDLNHRQKRAIHYMTEHRTITNLEYRELHNVSHKTAHIELTMLVDKGVAASEGLGRSTRYLLTAEVTN